MKELPDESVDMVMTSPPYWALRDYGVEGQLGLEPTFQEYINKLCDIFDEVKRVLKKEGTCWVNMGDTYMNDSSYSKAGRQGFGNDKIGMIYKDESQCPKKSLCQIPSRFAIEMCNRGWILRNEIIWHKPNCMPSSVKDRFTVDFEKLFFFTKSKKYYFETQYEPFHANTDVWYRQELRYGKQYNTKKPYKNNVPYANTKAQNPSDSKRRILEIMKTSKGRNKRCVWRITTKPYKEAHFATYPEALCETPIKAGCPEDGIVLDPFFGAGTTGLVAWKLGRKYIGIELNPEYIKIAEKRLSQQVLP